MSMCHTIRLRVAPGHAPMALAAIDAYLTALAEEDPAARQLVAGPVQPAEGTSEFVHLILCPGEAGCDLEHGSLPVSALHATLAPVLLAPPEHHHVTLDHEGQPD